MNTLPCPAGTCPHPAYEHSVYGCEDGCPCEAMPRKERCGAWGGCPLPAGHNMGQADIPANHHSQTPCSDPPCGHLDGLPCDTHTEEIEHARGDHTYCGLACEEAFNSDGMRAAILYRAIPGSESMLKELERRAEQRSPAAILLKAHAALADQAGKAHRIMSVQAGKDQQRIRKLKQRVAELEAELGIGSPWICPCCSKENRRSVCVICETYRPDPEDTE